MLGGWAFRCRQCPPDKSLVLKSERIEDGEESLLRAHLLAEHPELRVGKWLGDVLLHYSVDTVRK